MYESPSKNFFMYETDTSPNLENLRSLPKSLSESLEALHKADFLEEFIGDKLLTAIKAIGKVNNCILGKFFGHYYIVTNTDCIGSYSKLWF